MSAGGLREAGVKKSSMLVLHSGWRVWSEGNGRDEKVENGEKDTWRKQGLRESDFICMFRLCES